MVKIRFTAVVLPLSLAGYCSAWAQAADGTWVANNEWHVIGGVPVHEACTRMNTQIYWRNDEPCAYWTNGNGGILNGVCRSWGPSQSQVVCYPR